MPTVLYIDADACPVKEEVYRVARRYGLKTYVVSNGWMQVPREPLIEQVMAVSYTHLTLPTKRIV